MPGVLRRRGTLRHLLCLPAVRVAAGGRERSQVRLAAAAMGTVGQLRLREIGQLAVQPLDSCRIVRPKARLGEMPPGERPPRANFNVTQPRERRSRANFSETDSWTSSQPIWPAAGQGGAAGPTPVRRDKRHVDVSGTSFCCQWMTSLLRPGVLLPVLARRRAPPLTAPPVLSPIGHRLPSSRESDI